MNLHYIDKYSEDEIVNRGNLITEQNNTNSKILDTLTTKEIIEIFSKEDLLPQLAVSRSIPEIVRAIDAIYLRLKEGGKLFYLGTGTSGRLGVIDAAELPPTFCTQPHLVQGIIAGGNEALVKSSEDLEDNYYQSVDDLKDRKFSKKDCLIAITAGGTTPYVLSALDYSNKIEALSVAICCVPENQSKLSCDIDIRLITGPEVITGSTRLKAGTATKMALNMISSTVMIKLGKVYGNRMIDVSASNSKLLDRSLRILNELLNIDRNEGIKLLSLSKGSVKIALLVAAAGCSVEEAEETLNRNNNNLRQALRNCKINSD